MEGGTGEKPSDRTRAPVAADRRAGARGRIAVRTGAQARAVRLQPHCAALRRKPRTARHRHSRIAKLCGGKCQIV